MPHVVLLGDSIFDNGAYVNGGPDVCASLRALIHPRGTVSLCAVDGATATEVPRQVARIPAGATQLVLSVGGNDALLHMHLLDMLVASSSETLLLLADALDRFESHYRAALRIVLSRGLPTTVCTIYNAHFADPAQARCVRIAVALFNDVILRVAREHSLPSIDLRAVCTDTTDYVNGIEPSVMGGGKLAAAIMGALGVGTTAT